MAGDSSAKNGGKSCYHIPKILVTSGGGMGIIEVRDCVTTLGDDDGDDVPCAGMSKP